MPALGGDAFVRPDALGYWTSPALVGGRFFVRGRATAIFGETLAQDYVGLARFDDVDLQVPLFGALTLARPFVILTGAVWAGWGAGRAETWLVLSSVVLTMAPLQWWMARSRVNAFDWARLMRSHESSAR